MLKISLDRAHVAFKQGCNMLAKRHSEQVSTFHVQSVCAFGWKGLFLFPRISVGKINEEKTDSRRKRNENGPTPLIKFRISPYLVPIWPSLDPILISMVQSNQCEAPLCWTKFQEVSWFCEFFSNGSSKNLNYHNNILISIIWPKNDNNRA